MRNLFAALILAAPLAVVAVVAGCELPSERHCQDGSCVYPDDCQDGVCQDGVCQDGVCRPGARKRR